MKEILNMYENIKANAQQNDVKTTSCNDALTDNGYVVSYEARYNIRYAEKQKNALALKHEGVPQI